MYKRLQLPGIFLLANTVCFLLLYLVGNGFRYSWRLLLPALVISGVVVLLGSFAGYLFHYLRENKAARTGSYIIGLSASSILFLSFFAFGVLGDERREKTNAEKNRSDMAFGLKGSDGEKEGWIAYHALIKKFKDENSILLQGGSNNHKDTMLDGYSQRFYFFRFKYTIPTDSTVYVAKVMVHDTVPQLLFYNRIAATDRETIRRDARSLEEYNRTMKQVDALADSLGAHGHEGLADSLKTLLPE